jgi:hypothetical protein
MKQVYLSVITLAIAFLGSSRTHAEVFSSSAIMATIEKVANYFMTSNPDVGANSYVGGKERNSRIWTRSVFYMAPSPTSKISDTVAGCGEPLKRMLLPYLPNSNKRASASRRLTAQQTALSTTSPGRRWLQATRDLPSRTAKCS